MRVMPGIADSTNLRSACQAECRDCGPGRAPTAPRPGAQTRPSRSRRCRVRPTTASRTSDCRPRAERRDAGVGGGHRRCGDPSVHAVARRSCPWPPGRSEGLRVLYLAVARERRCSMKPLEVVEIFGAAWVDHDLDGAVALITKDCIFDNTAPLRMQSVMSVAPRSAERGDRYSTTRTRASRPKRHLRRVIAWCNSGRTHGTGATFAAST